MFKKLIYWKRETEHVPAKLFRPENWNVNQMLKSASTNQKDAVFDRLPYMTRLSDDI